MSALTQTELKLKSGANLTISKTEVGKKPGFNPEPDHKINIILPTNILKLTITCRSLTCPIEIAQQDASLIKPL